MSIKLYPHQVEAKKKLRSGSILSGGVGSGKSITSLAYFFEASGGTIEPFSTSLSRPKDLYIITTAKKRNSLEWERECSHFLISKDNRNDSISNILLVVDSWNNIGKYSDVENAFFIFDEQRVVGSGAWVKSFITIAKKNDWLLLTATPGDTWSDYIPVFVANGYYKNRTAFLRRHAVYSRFAKFPKIERYLEVDYLIKLKKEVLVPMPYEKKTSRICSDIICKHDKDLVIQVTRDRWNVYKDEPVRDSGALCYLLRKIVNSHPDRLEKTKDLIHKHNKIIIFYNFNYELDILRNLAKIDGISVAEYNGHKHQAIPTSNRWVYLVQYTSGSEGWNCVETNAIIFYSLNYSYKVMTQAAGRIDRINTKFKDLYYYRLRSTASIDQSIVKALNNKKNFNENTFISF
jgi:hypothetical protein